MSLPNEIKAAIKAHNEGKANPSSWHQENAQLGLGTQRAREIVKRASVHKYGLRAVFDLTAQDVAEYLRASKE